MPNHSEAQYEARTEATQAQTQGADGNAGNESGDTMQVAVKPQCTKKRHHTHTHTDMAAEGAMPGGLGGPEGPHPHREVPLPRYSTWANYPSPGNLGPPRASMNVCICMHV